ncbi:Conserved oligomeric Golgi complex subunit 6 [Vanrija pseudolonga]|uniref:Conserved oligomeric Golgi complex subunit 6 n=1 Tax=Vanrija pseudolonga TaxID=143232 RepID=A0AAF1BQ72_9TREE|nr:Conserved oligomeric Golgi complex subunit 6 [Vanrija pseudolonga]
MAAPPQPRPLLVSTPSGGSTSASGSSTPVPAASRNNPISLRIYKAIGTSFDDRGSREALEIASGFYASSKAKGKAKAEDGGDEAAAPIRRTLRGQSAATARRNLKRDVEARLAGGSQHFLEAFGEVDKKLDVLREHMLEMQSRCDQVQAELDQANSGTKYLLERADGLRSQRSSAQLRTSLVTLFLARFTLTQGEERALSSREFDLGPETFKALDHVEAIRSDCRALLGGDEAKMQAGLDIMASTGVQMEAGYTKIHRWLEFQFRQMTRDAQLEVSGVMREAVRRLGQRPGMLKEVLHVLTSTRQASVLSAFLDALTRGGPKGLPRPIEIHAHEPTRYVGDMLAWVHQATATEHELLESLFGVGNRARMVGAERSVLERTEAEKMVAEALDRDLEGLGRPLKLRIEQTLKSQEGVITTYRIVNLLQFYLVTMRKTIGPDALLSKALQELYEHADAAFFETLEAQGRSLLRFLHPPDANLSPPLALRDASQVLREIIAVYDTSLVDDAEREGDFAKLLNAAVDPAVEMCERMADLRKQSSPSSGAWDRDVFLVNCLEYLQHTLEIYPFTAPRVSTLQEQVQTHIESMTFEHHGKLLEQCGLAPVMKAIRTRPADTPLSRLPGATPKELTAALTQFSSFLTNHDPLTSPRLALLSNPRLAEGIHRTALRRIATAYAEVADHVLDKNEGYEFAETLLRRGRDEVEVALGVAEL